MNFDHILDKLITSTHPVAASIANGQDFSVLGIGFKKDMILKEHVTAVPAKLIVLDGLVTYQTAEGNTLLKKYAEIIIPANEKHAVIAHEDSMCLLIRAKLE